MLRVINENDYQFIKELLPRMNEYFFNLYLKSKTGYIIVDSLNNKVGIFLTTYFWERFPFIEHIIVKEEFRNKGFATQAILEYEKLKKEEGYFLILISTQVNEKAQFLYRKLGYIDCGSLFFENTKFDQPCELFLKKKIN